MVASIISSVVSIHIDSKTSFIFYTDFSSTFKSNSIPLRRAIKR